MKPACYIPAPTPVWTVDRVSEAGLKAMIGGTVLWAACKLVGLFSLIEGAV
jgi:uncharacterized membrane-anchored protein